MPADWLIKNVERAKESRALGGGETFSNSIVGTYVKGQRMRDGSILDESVRGQRLAFDR